MSGAPAPLQATWLVAGAMLRECVEASRDFDGRRRTAGEISYILGLPLAQTFRAFALHGLKPPPVTFEVLAILLPADEARARFDGGCTLREISEDLGVSDFHVGAYCRSLGLKTRPDVLAARRAEGGREGAARSHMARVRPEKAEEAFARALAGQVFESYKIPASPNPLLVRRASEA